MIEQCLREGIPLPDKIKNAPELLPGLEMYMNAFHDLTTCRHIGMGVGPVPFTAILEYARWHRFDQEHTEDLQAHISAMDSAYLGWANKKPAKGDK